MLHEIPLGANILMMFIDLFPDGPNGSIGFGEVVAGAPELHRSQDFPFYLLAGGAYSKGL